MAHIMMEAELAALSLLHESESVPKASDVISALKEIVNIIDSVTKTMAQRLIVEVTSSKPAAVMPSTFLGQIPEKLRVVLKAAIIAEDPSISDVDAEDKVDAAIKEIRSYIKSKERMLEDIQDEIKTIAEKIRKLYKPLSKALPKTVKDEDIEKYLKESIAPEQAISEVEKLLHELVKLYTKSYKIVCDVAYYLGNKAYDAANTIYDAVKSNEEAKKRLKIKPDKLAEVIKLLKLTLRKVEQEKAKATVAEVSKQMSKFRQLLAKVWKALKGEYGAKGIIAVLAGAATLYLLVWGITKKLVGASVSTLVKPITLFKKYFTAVTALGAKGIPLLILGIAAAVMLFAGLGSAIVYLAKFVAKKFK